MAKRFFLRTHYSEFRTVKGETIMKKWRNLLILVAFLSAVSQVEGQQVFRWVDEKGTLHFVDDLTLVPERYRKQVQEKEAPQEPVPPPSVSSGVTEGRTGPQPPSDPKDLYGRGEDWWRAKAKGANEKLQDAQQKYDSTSQTLKAKEQQQGEGQFKSHGPRKRLKSEIEKLEEKAKENEKELEEARGTVEKTLPRQAEDYKADPDWLKPKEQKEIPPPEGAPDSKK